MYDNSSSSFITTTHAWMQHRTVVTDRSSLLHHTKHHKKSNLKSSTSMLFMVNSSNQNDHEELPPPQQQQLTDDSYRRHTNHRRTLLQSTASTAMMTVLGMTTTMTATTTFPLVAHAVGPVKIALTPLQYSAVICPPDRPIPGEKAMIGMRGLCVTVRAKLDAVSPKSLEKVGVYGFVNDGDSGDSVLANNPDGGTDAGQFAMIESVTPQDTTITFEFIAAVPRDKDLSIYDNGIGPLNFSSLRLISYPGGQQFGAISPCEMNEFSDECEEWERENGPYQKAEYMVKSNPRTKGS